VSNANPTSYQYFDLGGRLIATQDANGNVTTQTLLAGTGYGGQGGMVAPRRDPLAELRREVDIGGSGRTHVAFLDP